MSLQEILAAYNKTYNQASGHKDKASAARNVAATSAKLAKQSLTQAGNVRAQQLAIYHLREALNFFDKAHGHGSFVMPNSWKDSLQTAFCGCVEDAKEFVGNMDDFEKRISTLEIFKAQIYNCVQRKAEICIELATQMFRLGITVLEQEKYKKTLYLMKECYQPVEEARQWAGDREDILTEVNVLQQDIFMVQCRAESIKSREIGDDLLKNTIKDDEDLNVTAVYEVLDWYKQAVLLTKEVEIEMEAIAQSRLGKVFAEVLKVAYKANEYFVQCIHLAHSLHPKTFHGVDWYQIATTYVENYQKERLEQEASKWQNERQKYVEELKDELATLETKRCDSDKIVFLKFVYKTHPPKNKKKLPSDAKMKKMKGSEIKNLYRNAVLNYHPDRNNKDGKKWLVMCEEITKHMTNVYETYKAMD